MILEEDLKAMRDQIRRLERKYLITMVLVIATAVSYLLKYQSMMNVIDQSNELTGKMMCRLEFTCDLYQEVLNGLDNLNMTLQENFGEAEK